MTFLELFKIIGVGFITLICYVIIKPMKPELAIFVSLAGACVILIFCVDALTDVIFTVTNLVEKTGINKSLVSTILKIIGIGYLVEFSSSLCQESGCAFIADKISLAGKVCILVLALPIITNLLNIIIEILP